MTESLEAIERASRDRLYPSITNPNWLILRRRREIFKKWIAREQGRDLQVLDVGGRVHPYRSLLQNRIRHYVAIDIKQTPLVDIVARGEQIPLADERFDLVICTQILEYVMHPETVISEIYRVLKPGGSILISAPAVTIRDADEECWRFFPSSLRMLLKDFADVEVEPEGSSVIGFFRIVSSGLDVLVRKAALRTAYRWTLCPVLNLLAELLDAIAASKNQQITSNYAAFARK